MIIKGNFIYMTSRTDMQIRQQQFCMLRMELYSRFIQNFQSNFARRK